MTNNHHQSCKAFPIQDAHHATTPLATSTIVPLRSHEMPREPYRLIGGGSHRREHEYITHTSMTCQGTTATYQPGTPVI